MTSYVILSEAKDLKVRILRSFGVFAPQDDEDRVIRSREDGEGSQNAQACRTLRSFAPLRMTAFSLLLSSCASHPPPATPIFTSVPSVAVESMCARLHDEGMNGDVFAMKMTQPLITPATLQALAEATFSRGKADDRGAREAASAPPVPLDVPAKSCIGRFVDAADTKADVMLLEFSRPFPNPFARAQIGLVVRLSLGGEAATWYWLPIGERSGTWIAGAPSMLAVRE